MTSLDVPTYTTPSTIGIVAVWVGFWHIPVLSLGPQVLDGLELELELISELEELPGGDLFVRSAMF